MNIQCYDPNLDERIFEIIEDNGEIRFNTLVNLLCKTPRTISKHLEFLANEQKLLIWKRNVPGKKGSIKFLQTAEKQRKYGLLTINYSNKRGICKEWKKNMKVKEAKERKKKAIFFLLLLAVANDFTSYKVSQKPQLGDVLIRDSKGNSLTISEEYTEEGFLPKDLDRKDFQLSIIHNLLHSNRFTKEDAEDIIKEFEKNEDIKLRKIGRRNKEIAYSIEDDGLRNLLIQCCYILSIVFDRIREYWYILSETKRPPDEYNWFRFIVGDKTATKFFQKIEENRAKGKTIKDLYTEFHMENTNNETAKKIIGNIEKYSPEYFTKNVFKKRLFTDHIVKILEIPCKNITSNKKIEQIIKVKKYSFIVDELLDIVYPSFSRELFKVQLNII